VSAPLDGNCSGQLASILPHHRRGRIRDCGLIDRSGYIFEPAGLSWRRVMELRVRLKVAGTSLAQGDRRAVRHRPDASIAAATSRLPRRSILVDATAARHTAAPRGPRLQRGIDSSSANKLPARRCSGGVRPAATPSPMAAEPVPRTRGDRRRRFAGDRHVEQAHRRRRSRAQHRRLPVGHAGLLFGELGRGDASPRRFATPSTPATPSPIRAPTSPASMSRGRR
jgi:hypothetical protein